MKPFSVVRDLETGEEIIEVSITGQALLDTPLLNKGMGFTEEEREELLLTGLLPHHISTVEEQLLRNYENYQHSKTDLERYLYLASLQDRNETLFYQFIGRHITEMLPIIYTPTVGLACQQYSRIYRRPRGLYISYPHRHEIDRILDNAPHPETAVIVVTDGERILGLGDLGVGGMGIPVGKLALYTLCAGIDPATTLPVLLDAGTDNSDLLEEPLYVGWRHPRVRGTDYDEFIEAFVMAVTKKFPNILLQWEDFARHNAGRLLNRYRDRICSFNDDIQGTGAVALAGLLAAAKVTGAKISHQQIVVLGAGSAASGVCHQLVAAMKSEGLSDDEARSNIWIVDIGGLVHSQEAGLEGFKLAFAQPVERISNWQLSNRDFISLADTVRNVKPAILIGTAAQPGAFNREVVTEMARHTKRPIIFPLSNPTSKSEAAPADLIEWTTGRAIIATGSPFPPVEYEGRVMRVGQCNNAYIFPGVGLGVIATGAWRVTDAMFVEAARALAELSPVHKDSTASLFPALEDVREVSRQVARAVGLQAARESVAEPISEDDLLPRIEAKMWTPRYLRYRYNP